MAKRSHRALSKKGLKNRGLVRVTQGGERVWLFNKETFKTLREVVSKYGNPI